MIRNDTLFSYSVPTNCVYALVEHANEHIEFFKTRVFEVHKELLPLFDKLVEERPTWRFKSTVSPSYTREHKVTLTDFYVYEGDEQLGSIVWEHGWSGKKAGRICFNNHRLESKRERNHCNYTYSVDTATNRILKAFHTKTRKERAKDVYQAAREMITGMSARATWDFDRKFRPVQELMLEYMMDNWDGVSSYITSRGGTPDPDMPELFKRRHTAITIRDALTNSKCAMLRDEGNGYLVTREYANDRNVYVATNDTLNDHYKTSLGILKLLDAGTAIVGVGLRVDQTTFLILDEEKTNVSE